MICAKPFLNWQARWCSPQLELRSNLLITNKPASYIDRRSRHCAMLAFPPVPPFIMLSSYEQQKIWKRPLEELVRR